MSISGLGIRDHMKGGWQKGKDAKPKDKLKGLNQKAAGWMGKGKDPNEESQEHTSTPITSLKDPSSFGPPPKSVRYHGATALPPPTQLTIQNHHTPSNTGGWGTAVPQSEIRAKQEAEEEERRRQEEEALQPKPPPMPYRANTTGLSTTHLPPPPGRKDGADGRTPLPAPAPVAGKSKPPGLPPRLPPRQNSSPAPSPPPPTYGAATSQGDAHKGILNQGALSRLGAAGISVPGFGIGTSKSQAAIPAPPIRTSSSNSSLAPPPARKSSPQIPSRTSSPQLQELSSRFSRLTSSSSPSSTSTTTTSPTPSSNTPQGTTLAQKQSALRTASAFHKDPTSISLTDARTAASTAHNFHARHGEQAKSGFAAANKLNAQYGIAEKVGSSYAGSSRGRDGHVDASSSSSSGHDGVAVGYGIGGLNGLNTQPVLAKKKPAPPPPPKKRAELSAGVQVSGMDYANAPAPPPIPMATKPKPKPMVR
ncbi:putative Altered inheritance of mitochondria protein 3 [Sclerotinia borealis F-4128]|uniref:Putative Altered inheritance of mitochondria protein 3 n=1 Tax=Sclerotinia borealis (strain F-4128) TaxID=1432307 RepID=W9CJD3_SCLBF|nr:putative Altered inheritance of mitochondria protein 3 [Sclerotinia borealis F-4128]